MIRALVELGGARTGLTVPLVRDGTVLGILAVFRQDRQTLRGKTDRLPAQFRDPGDDRDGKRAPAA